MERKKEKRVKTVDKVEINWGKKIDKYGNYFGISPSYLKALCVLECSGKKKIKPRFEKKVYKKLLYVKKNKNAVFENITNELIKNTPNKVLYDMAKSWGPLQIMGYKCIWLSIDIEDLKNEKNLYYSIKWINETYGDYVRQKKYKHAFHIHNAGKPYPKKGKALTYDPDYVKNGLKYLKYYQKKKITNSYVINIDY